MRTNYDFAIDVQATGKNIRRLRMERGFSVQDVQVFFGFDSPRSVYKWQAGETLPTVDNLLLLSKLFKVSLEDILVLREEK